MNIMKFFRVNSLLLSVLISTNAHAGLDDLLRDLKEIILPTVTAAIVKSEPGVALFLSASENEIDGLKNYKDIVDECVINLDSDQCGEAVLNAGFHEACKVVAFGQANSILDVSQALDIDSRTLGDVAEMNDLYPAIVRIFDQDLNTPGFSDYVKQHVKHYVSGVVGLGAEARAANGKIYYATSDPSPELVMHELVHIWQYYTQGTDKFIDTYCDEIFNEEGQPSYRFYLDSGRQLESYNLEQQAEIIEEYYSYSEAFRVGCDDASGRVLNDNFLNCDNFSSDLDRLAAFERVVKNTQIDPDFSVLPTALHIPSGTKVVEFGDSLLGNRFNDCSFKQTYSVYDDQSEYTEYSISCNTGIYNIAIQKTYTSYRSRYSPTCRFYPISLNISGAGTCDNWRVYTTASSIVSGNQ